MFYHIILQQISSWFLTASFYLDLIDAFSYLLKSITENIDTDSFTRHPKHLSPFG